MLVAQPKRRHCTRLLLEAGKPDALTLALTGAGIRPGLQPSAQVDGGFLESLLAHLAAPYQAGHDGLDHAVAPDGEHPAGVGGLLPPVERVDQIKARPRHLDARVCLALGKRRFHRRQALIEREP